MEQKGKGDRRIGKEKEKKQTDKRHGQAGKIFRQTKINVDRQTDRQTDR